MRKETIEILDFIETTPLGLYQQVDAIVRLLATEDADEVIGALSPDTRARFVFYARENLATDGPRFVVAGSALPRSALIALRAWLKKTL